MDLSLEAKLVLGLLAPAIVEEGESTLSVDRITELLLKKTLIKDFPADSILGRAVAAVFSDVLKELLEVGVFTRIEGEEGSLSYKKANPTLYAVEGSLHYQIGPAIFTHAANLLREDEIALAIVSQLPMDRATIFVMDFWQEYDSSDAPEVAFHDRRTQLRRLADLVVRSGQHSENIGLTIWAIKIRKALAVIEGV